MDEAAHQAHVESAHAEQYAWTEGIPNLESRERFVYETDDWLMVANGYGGVMNVAPTGACSALRCCFEVGS